MYKIENTSFFRFRNDFESWYFMNCSIAKVRTTVSWLSIYKRETVGARVRVRGERTILLWIPLVGHLLPSITTSAPTHFLISWCYFDTGNYASYSWIMRATAAALQTQRIHHSRLTDNFQWIDFITSLFISPKNRWLECWKSCERSIKFITFS